MITEHGNAPPAAAPRHSPAPLIELRGVTRTFPSPAGAFTALAGIDLTVQPGETLAIVGRSGSGKSTLLNITTGIDRPSSGEVRVGGVAVHTLAGGALAAWRGRHVGIIFQFFQLLPTLTVAENVMLPMDLCATYPPRERRPRALALLDRVGIAEQADKLPAALSGGQQQRAAVARALANDPAILAADEPTGNLDSRAADAVFRLFADLAAAGKTVVLATHDRDAGRWADRVVTLTDGAIDAAPMAPPIALAAPATPIAPIAPATPTAPATPAGGAAC